MFFFLSFDSCFSFFVPAAFSLEFYRHRPVSFSAPCRGRFFELRVPADVYGPFLGRLSATTQRASMGLVNVTLTGSVFFEKQKTKTQKPGRKKRNLPTETSDATAIESWRPRC